MVRVQFAEFKFKWRLQSNSWSDACVLITCNVFDVTRVTKTCATGRSYAFERCHFVQYALPENHCVVKIYDINRDEAVLRQTSLATLIQSCIRFFVLQLSAELSDVKSLVKPPTSVASRSDILESTSDTSAKVPPTPVESNTLEQLNDLAFGDESSTTEVESLGSGEETTIVEKLFASKTAVVARCKCGCENVRDNCTMVVELNYSAFVQDEQASHWFEEVFVKSLLSDEQTTHAWCEKCAKFQPTIQSKKILSLSDVVSVSCNVATDKDKEFWTDQCEALEENSGRMPTPWVDSNFVLQLKHVSQSDFISFDVKWKVACLLFFCSGDLNETHFVQVVSAIDERVFALDECLSVRRRLSSSTFVPLDAHEMPKKEDMVALDAEFVTLNQEEAEFHSDGTTLTVKPSHVSLTRVRCTGGMNIQSETHDSVEGGHANGAEVVQTVCGSARRGVSNFARLLGDLYEKGRTHKLKINANDIY